MSITLAVAATAFTLYPFGGIEGLLHEKNPWYGFHASESVLYIGRIQKLKGESCEAWKESIRNGKDSGEGKTLSISALEKAWAPWKPDEKDEISDCHQLPCKVKLNEPEVKNLEKLESGKRYDEFLKLIQNRVSTYVQTGKRDAYEYPGGRSDLWVTLGTTLKMGTGAGLPSAKQAQIFARKLDFGSDQMKVLRQVLDRQIMDDGMAVWVRDIYTNHYFDSWGEWTRLQCGSSAAGEVTIVQLLALELDLLKNTDLLSKLSRGKMKSVVKENGSRYLDEAYQRYLKEAHNVR